MPVTWQSRSISERSHRVKDTLNDLRDQLEHDKNQQLLIKLTDIEDVLDRYTLWTGNLGALHKPDNKLSLDYRVLASPEIRDQICEFIDDLQEAIDDLIDTNQDGNINEIEVDGHEGIRLDESKSIIDVISQCIRSLFKIGTLVRKASPRDRFQQALQKSNSAFPASFDIDHVQHTYSKLSAPSAQRLAERMGNANAKRRQFITYCRDHNAKLSETDVDDGSTTKKSSKATTLPPTGLAQLEELDKDTASMMTTSTTFESSLGHTLPSLKELSPDLETFEVHAFNDLKAYICTIGGPECGGELFGSRDTWFDHELNTHRSKYMCLLCRKDIVAQDAMITHMNSVHNDLTVDHRSMLVNGGRVVPTHFGTNDCPFCDDWANELRSRIQVDDKDLIDTGSNIPVSKYQFKRHVAAHQEHIAAFVVPTSGEGIDNDSVESHDHDNAATNPEEEDMASDPDEAVAINPGSDDWAQQLSQSGTDQSLVSRSHFKEHVARHQEHRYYGGAKPGRKRSAC
ncbi:hypothetical protein M426DRAFT_13984 [Hypoxylon sp. CI-4A]|nr:hypothetical protein M426DRAFT_13984 [Hypoxylon sp. CI-4A]